jgi:large subunit ribosomal protein L18
VRGKAKGKLSAIEKRRRRASSRVHWRARDRHVLTVFRSARHVYAQIVEPGGRTVAGVSSLSKEIRESQQKSGNVESAKLVGKLVAAKAIELGFRKVVFNRNGYLYHGRVKALAEAAREAGLEF